MKWRGAPPRLLTGAVGAGCLALACTLGPAILPTPPPHDPVHAALLPPAARVICVLLDDGALMVAPASERRADTLVLRGNRHLTEVPLHRVVEVRHQRFWLGSDRLGHDVLHMLMRGGRVSLLIAVLSVTLALIVGGSVGLTAATAGRVVDTILMRLVDAALAFPVLFLMILVAALVRPSPLLLVAVLGLTSWMGLARVVRGQVLSLRNRPFVLAARTAGSRWHRIWALHYAPNLIGPVAQDTALRLGDLVLAEATLSFLGLGVSPATPTWGAMVNEGHKVMLDGWWLATFPGLAIASLVICLALIGDGLQQLVEDRAAGEL